MTVSKPEEFNGYPELKRKLYSALSESDEGELSIGIPPQVTIEATNQPTAPTTSTTANAASQATHEFMALTVRIEYSLRNPVDGIQFVLPSDAYPFVSLTFSLFSSLVSDVFVSARSSRLYLAYFPGRRSVLGTMR